MPFSSSGSCIERVSQATHLQRAGRGRGEELGHPGGASANSGQPPIRKKPPRSGVAVSWSSISVLPEPGSSLQNSVGHVLEAGRGLIEAPTGRRVMRPSRFGAPALPESSA